MHFTPFHHLQQLDPDAAKVIAMFAEFQDYVNEDLALEFFETIPGINLPTSAFAASVHHLEGFGLIVPQGLISGNVHQLHPLLRWLLPLQDSSIDRGVMQEAFVLQMQSLGSELFDLLESSSAEERNAGFFWSFYEHLNLHRALAIALKKGQQIFHLFTPLNAYYQQLGWAEEQSALLESIWSKFHNLDLKQTSESVRMDLLAVVDMLAYIYQEQDLLEASLQAFHQARIIVESFPAVDRYERLLINILNGQTGSLIRMGRWDEVKLTADQALALTQKFDKKKEMALAYANLARYATETHEYTLAENYYLKAIVLLDELEAWLLGAELKMDLGSFYVQLDRLDDAEQMFEKAGQVFQEFNDLPNVFLLALNLAAVSFRKGALESSLDHYKKALNYFLEIGDIGNEIMVYENMGVIALHQNEFETAKEYYKRVFDYYLHVNNKLGLARILAKVVTLEQVSLDQDFLPQLVRMVEAQFSAEEREEIILMIQLFQNN